MNPKLRIQLLTLANGQKLMRMEDDATGLSVERKLAPAVAVVAQKARLLRLFQAMLASDSATA